MKADKLQLLANRSLDQELTPDEKALLVRALKADPLLRAEYEEMRATHHATQSLFQRIELPKNFSKQVMARTKAASSPLPSARLPRVDRPRRRRVRVQRRRTAAIWGWVGGFATAAGMVLVLGLMFGVFDSPTMKQKDSLADDGRDGLDVEPDNRTAGTNSSPKTPEAPDARVNHESSGTSSIHNDQSVPESVTGNNDSGRVERPGPVRPPINHRSNPTPESGDETSDTPSAEVKKEKPKPLPPIEPRKDNPSKKDSTGTAVITRDQIGRLNLLGGRVERMNSKGEWERLSDQDSIRDSDRLRTSSTGNASICMGDSCVVMDRRTEATLTEDSIELFDGTIGVERDKNARNPFSIKMDRFTLDVDWGVMVVEVKSRRAEFSLGLGIATLTGDDTTEQTLYTSGTLDVSFSSGKTNFKESTVMFDDWFAEARAQHVVAAINDQLDTREFKSGDRRYLDSRLSRSLERLVAYSAERNGVIDFMAATIENESLGVKDIIKVVAEVEEAFVDHREHDVPSLLAMGKAASSQSTDFANWRVLFHGLITPRVEAPAKKQVVKKKAADCPPPDCPNEDNGMVKRVDKPKKKTVKKTVKKPQQ